MQRYFKARDQPDKFAPDLDNLTVKILERSSSQPITLLQINNLPENIKRRVYRGLIPPLLLSRMGLDPISWVDPNDLIRIQLTAEPGTGTVVITATFKENPDDIFFILDLADNPLNGIEINLIVMNDPKSMRFGTDFDETGRPTKFGTLRRNLAEEQRAKQAGMAPGQNRATLGASRLVFGQFDGFLSTLGHRAYWIEPPTYSSAWVFEQRGLAYVSGHKLMDDIHREFLPGGVLTKALDSSTPFRDPEQAASIRGRAWAVHDGILDVIGNRWEKVRMIKQVGRHASVVTAPDVPF
jgi:hypothetical protein